MAILTLLDIERVICVDDEYSRQHGDELIVACGDPQDETVRKLRELDFLREESIPEDRKLLARDYLAGLDSALLEELYRRWRAQRHDFEDDLQYAVLLSDVLTGIDFKGVSLADWRSRQTEYLNVSAGRRIAVIFDLDMHREAGGREDEGAHLLKELLESPARDRVLCGILSHHVKPGEEYDGPARAHRDPLCASRLRLMLPDDQPERQGRALAAGVCAGRPLALLA